MADNVCSVTLAAGAGSRMPDDMRPKSCCRIGTISVIDNLLRTYEQAGIHKHAIVIGCAADRVMDEVVRKHRNVMFAYQRVPRGTGDAVQCALDLLDAVAPPETIVISAGDKVIAPYVVRGLLETYVHYGCDLCLAAGPSPAFPSSGRIIERDGLVQAIIEVPDINAMLLGAKLRALPQAEQPSTVADLEELVREYFPNPNKLAKCLPALSDILSVRPQEPVRWERVAEAVADMCGEFQPAGGRVSVQEAASAPLANVFVYAGAFEPIRDAVRKLGSDNVQGERYLTGMPQILAAEGRRVRLFRIGHPEHVMSFNGLSELESVRRVYAQRYSAETRYPSLQQWGNALAGRDRAEALNSAVRGLAERIGPDRPALLVRSPGRINLMGRHVDHQGGVCNQLAIDREIAVVASPRDDDRVNLWNSAPDKYPYRSFSVGEVIEDADWNTWLRSLDTPFAQPLGAVNGGDWVNYVKGAALRLQDRFDDRPLRGMDAFLCGNIPVAAGLGSSSALLVGAAEALIELNGLNVRVAEFVDLYGEGEWFVGTHDRYTEQTAVRHGRSQEVMAVSFFPFRILGRHPFPDGCTLILCHSGHSAHRNQRAGDLLNVRLACYHMARETIKEQFPQLAPRIAHLRDVNTDTLQLSLTGLYRLLARVPNDPSPEQVRERMASDAAVARCLADIDPSRHSFPLRDMAMYGLAECERSAKTGPLLDAGDPEAVGAMMRRSHDGDRVTRWRPHREPFDSHVTDERIADLIARAGELQPLDDVNAALWQQPGAYDCSTPELDLMVDCLADCPGVLGAQLSGAGLGGCVMVLARHDAVDRVQHIMTERYYGPRKVEPRMFVCRPAHGTHVLTSLDGNVPTAW